MTQDTRVVIAIPSFAWVKGWHATHQVYDAGAIALCHQGSPPHPKPDSCHSSLVPADKPFPGLLTVSRFSSQTGGTKPS